MSNHYHLVMETPDGDLSRGMRQSNGVYTQRFNARHGRVGHVFQGRYKAFVRQGKAPSNFREESRPIPTLLGEDVPAETGPGGGLGSMLKFVASYGQ